MNDQGIRNFFWISKTRPVFEPQRKNCTRHKPAISAASQALRIARYFELFDRSGRSVVLTSKGRRRLLYIEKIPATPREITG